MIGKRAIIVLSALALVTVGISAAVYTQPADAATVNANLQSEPINLSGESQDGQVDSVVIDLAGTIEYAGFEHGVNEIGIYTPGDSYIYNAEDPDASSGTLTVGGDTDRTPGARLYPYPYEDPSVDEDGATETTTTPVNVTVVVSGPDGEGNSLGREAETTITREVTVTITNLPDENASVSADFDWDATLYMSEDQ